MTALTVQLDVEAGALLDAIRSLADLAETRGEAVHAFLDGLDSSAQLLRFDGDRLPTTWAGNFRIALEPSDLLRDFLLAARAGECDGL